MSAKWRAVQHRHRYTYNSVVFPKPYIETLNLLPPETLSYFEFFPRMKDFTSLTSTYSQISAAKDLSSTFTQLLNSPHIQEGLVSTAVRLYMEVLFLENSLPLHRTLISPLTKNKKFLPLISSCFVTLCKEHADSGNNGKKRFLVSRAALSLMGYPKLGFLNEEVEKCCILVAGDIAAGLTSVISEVDCGSRPSPLVMEQCQDAMSCLYYLLQKFPHRLSVPEEGFCTFEMIISIILTVLKSTAFSRDCLVAAGVSFCAAIQARVRAHEVANLLSEAVFDISGEGGSIMELAGNLCLEIKGFSILSRLCLLRGMLTAVSRPALNTCFISASGSQWTLLYDAILPELCLHCEKPIDSHFNFHVLTILQICLQQMKASIMADLTDVSGDYDPLTEKMTGRLLRIIWNNLEDPLSQTVKQVHLIFDLLLDIKSSLPLKDGDVKNRTFLYRISSDLLRLGARCKGKYVPLASIGKRMGSNSLLELNPNLLFETINGYVDDDVCCAITSFLKCFLECLRNESWSRDGVEEGYETFRSVCLPPLMRGLLSGNSKLRTNLNTYALPSLLEVDSDSIFSMLSFISIGPSLKEVESSVGLKVDSCVAALVSLLKVSRSLCLIEGDIDLDSDSSSVAVVCFKGTNVQVLVDWLILALTNADESLRIDAAELLFLNPKTASLPSYLELKLMRKAVPLNMRCSSTAFQMKWTSLFRKFFSRVRIALERQTKQGLWQPATCNGSSGSYISTDAFAGVSVISREDHLFQFMKWLSSFLFCSCYPSGPYERKAMAMELILVMMDVWPPKMIEGNHHLSPYSNGFTSQDSTLLLVGSIIDSWDKLRTNSFRILVSFPTPLPGISSHDTLNMAIHWAKRLVCSPRVRESDAGALFFRLLFKKYVLELGWGIGYSLKTIAQIIPKSDLATKVSITVRCDAPLVAYISALVDWLLVSVEEGERDLYEACRSSFVHGVLLTLRYTFEELDWSSKEVMSSRTEFQRILSDLFELIVRVTSLALWVVSADAWHMPYDMDDAIDDANIMLDSSVMMDSKNSSLEQVYAVKKSDNDDDDEKPAEHAVMVGCWLAMKEASLLLGTIIRKVTLPSCSSIESLKNDSSIRNGMKMKMSGSEDGLLDLQQLESIGSHFLQVLLKMKHNGAIDKTRAGFTALCHRLLCSNDPRLCKMTEAWMGQLMERTIAKGQTVDDLLRRSAGIPAAFIAFFLSEPDGTPKILLPKALSWLINVAKQSLCEDNKDHNQTNKVLYGNSMNDWNEANGSVSKTRDEGVIPTVHAFNVLRASFNDTNLAADTSGFCAEALIIAIRSFSSPHWEVRNSACLAYSALVRRMIGFLNVHKRESSRRALTGIEFFHRYPALHPFLCSELEIATKQLRDDYSMNSDMNKTKAIHPSLCPILILLSRLKPSLIASGADDLLDPLTLLSFIHRCGTQSNLRIRVLAARALVGLVSNEKLQAILSKTARSLPDERHEMARTGSSFNSIHGVLLQLSFLLDNNCRNLTDATKKDDILGEIIHTLASYSWIGSIRSCPCPMLNCSYLLVLDHMNSIALSYSSKHVVAIQSLLANLALECMKEKNISGPALFDPTMVELRKQATASYFDCLFSTRTEGPELWERIVSCISDSMDEVRIIALKKLLQLTNLMNTRGGGDNDDDDGSAICIWIKTTLLSTLMQVLSKEDNPKCVYYILKIISSCSALQVSGFIDWNTTFCFWDTLVHLRKTIRLAKTWEISLCCMAICTKMFAKMLRSFALLDQRPIQGEATRAFKCIDSFVILTKQLSAPSEPVNTRRAVADAIVASGLLEEAAYIASHVSNNCILSETICVVEEEIEFNTAEFVHLYANRILDLWFICIQLLEDEDVGLRQNLAGNVQKYVDFGCSEVAIQVDRVIELSIGFLSKVFGHWLGYIQYLLIYVSMAASSVRFQGDLVRKIFEKEIDNHHEEKLLICQICCFHLEKLLVFRSEGANSNNKRDELLQRWRLRFCNQLISFVNDFHAKEGDNDWIGGIGNHKDAFISLYALLLCNYVIFRSSEGLKDGDELYLSKLSELKKDMRPFLRNPLICNLYIKLIRLHEKLGVSFGLDPLVLRECGSSWEEFDPYFLLS